MPKILARAENYLYQGRQFIKKLQHAPEPAKKKMLIFASAGSITLIVVLWLVYLNLTLPGMPKKETVAAAPEAKEGVGDTMVRGFSKIKEDFDVRFSKIKVIINKDLNFIKDQLRKRNEVVSPRQNFEYLPPTAKPVEPARIR